jgi:hypothetical protein
MQQSSRERSKENSLETYRRLRWYTTACYLSPYYLPISLRRRLGLCFRFGFPLEEHVLMGLFECNLLKSCCLSAILHGSAVVLVLARQFMVQHGQIHVRRHGHRSLECIHCERRRTNKNRGHVSSSAIACNQCTTAHRQKLASEYVHRFMVPV